MDRSGRTAVWLTAPEGYSELSWFASARLTFQISAMPDWL
jgi:hypothetical protein